MNRCRVPSKWRKNQEVRAELLQLQEEYECLLQKQAPSAIFHLRHGTKWLLKKGDTKEVPTSRTKSHLLPMIFLTSQMFLKLLVTRPRVSRSATWPVMNASPAPTFRRSNSRCDSTCQRTKLQKKQLGFMIFLLLEWWVWIFCSCNSCLLFIIQQQTLIKTSIGNYSCFVMLLVCYHLSRQKRPLSIKS